MKRYHRSAGTRWHDCGTTPRSAETPGTHAMPPSDRYSEKLVRRWWSPNEADSQHQPYEVGGAGGDRAEDKLAPRAEPPRRDRRQGGKGSGYQQSHATHRQAGQKRTEAQKEGNQWNHGTSREREE